MMKYADALQYLFGLEFYGIKLGLENMYRLMELVGNPHQKVKAIHIAGTNGKGSVSCYIKNILQHTGYNVGMYTSPHLERFEERIRINDALIPEADVARLTEFLIPLINQMANEEGHYHPTYFEVTTAMALLYFVEKQVDYVVWEVGLGGRLDATNVVDAPVCVITQIDFDHMKQLGSTIAEIASEKSKIIKPGATVITGVQGDAWDVIEAEALRQQAKLIALPRDIQYEVIHTELLPEPYQEFNYLGSQMHLSNLKIKMLGEHQVFNATLAIAAVEALLLNDSQIIDIDMVKNKPLKNLVPMNPLEQSITITPPNLMNMLANPSSSGDVNFKRIKGIVDGLDATFWPGRFEVIPQKPLIVLDGAHNESGAISLAKTLTRYFPGKRIHMVLGISEGKEREQIFKHLVPLVEDVVLTAANYHKAVDPDAFKSMVTSFGKPCTIAKVSTDAVKYALNKANLDDVVCITGSLYLIGEVRPLFFQKDC